MPAASQIQAEHDMHAGPVRSEQITTHCTMGGIATHS